VFSVQILQENTFLKTKPNFSLTGKCFSLTNFSNDKQTHESLESDFSKTTFRKTNTTKRENTFLETKPNFSLTGKYFLLTSFFNSKQIQENLESDFSEIIIQETNMEIDLNLIIKMHWHLNFWMIFEIIWISPEQICFLY